MTQEGFLYVFNSVSGRQLMPELLIGEVENFESAGCYLVVILKDKKLMCWNIRSQSVHIESSIKNLESAIFKIQIKENGELLIETQSGEGYLYDLELRSWVRIKDPSFIQKPDERMGGWNPGSLEEVLSVDLQTYQDFTLAQMEMQLLRLKKLNYSEEYAYNILRYSQMLADKGDTLRLWDICLELKVNSPNLLASIMPILNAHKFNFRGINC